MRSMVGELRSHMLWGRLNERVRVHALQQKIPHDATQLSSVAMQLSHAAAKSRCSQINIFLKYQKKPERAHLHVGTNFSSPGHTPDVH